MVTSGYLLHREAHNDASTVSDVDILKAMIQLETKNPFLYFDVITTGVEANIKTMIDDHDLSIPKEC